MHKYRGTAETLPLALLALLQKLDTLAPDMPYLIKYNGRFIRLLDKDNNEFGTIYKAKGVDGKTVQSARHTWFIELGE